MSGQKLPQVGFAVQFHDHEQYSSSLPSSFWMSPGLIYKVDLSLHSVSWLLDLYLTTIPERIKNIENVMNTLSEYEGIQCIVHLKGDFKKLDLSIIAKTGI